MLVSYIMSLNLFVTSHSIVKYCNPANNQRWRITKFKLDTSKIQIEIVDINIINIHFSFTA